MMLGLALLLGVAAVVLARSWLAQQQAGSVVVKEEKIPLTTVVVANATLLFGNRIEREQIKMVDWPASSVPEGVFHTVDELLAGNDPKVVLRRIDIGEPIMAAKLTGSGQRATLSALVTGELRAVTIRVNDVVGVAGFVLPGDRVDILLTREMDPGSAKSAATDILLQNVKVLGIDQEADDRQDKPQVAKAVTVEVTPEQAQKLVLGQQVGTLNLLLRKNDDVAESSHAAVAIKDLQPEVKAEPAPRAAAKAVERSDDRSLITITRGIKIEDYRVEPEGGLPMSNGRARMSRPINHQEEAPAATEEPESLTPGKPAVKSEAATGASETAPTAAPQ
jgi:pilus assembly protein CpaB